MGQDLHLYKMFSSFGAIAPKGVRAMLNREDGTCRGIGFINFLESEAAQAAIVALDGAVLPNGKNLAVKIKKGVTPEEKDVAAAEAMHGRLPSRMRSHGRRMHNSGGRRLDSVMWQNLL